jgi:hypothetical protein
MSDAQGSAARCACCQREIPQGAARFTLRLDLFASAGEVRVSEEELDRSQEEEIRRLLEELSAMSPAEVEEETDRVFERHTFTLCGPCRERLHARLQRSQAGVVTH